MEENEEILPFLEGRKPINVSLACSIIELMNVLLQEFIGFGNEIIS